MWPTSGETQAPKTPAETFNKPIAVDLAPTSARWWVFMHTSDLRLLEPGPGGLISPMRGQGQLGEHAADYVLLYEDGSEERLKVRRRRQLGAFQRRWGENCFEAVSHRKPHPVQALHERRGEIQPPADWGRTQTRATAADGGGSAV